MMPAASPSPKSCARDMFSERCNVVTFARFHGRTLSTGDVKDGVGVLGVLAEGGDRLSRWNDEELDTAAGSLVGDPLDDGEGSMGAGADDEAAAVPGDALL